PRPQRRGVAAARGAAAATRRLPGDPQRRAAVRDPVYLRHPVVGPVAALRPLRDDGGAPRPDHVRRTTSGRAGGGAGGVERYLRPLEGRVTGGCHAPDAAGARRVGTAHRTPSVPVGSAHPTDWKGG